MTPIPADQLIATVIATICLYTGFLVITRISLVKEKRECLYFFITALMAAAWALQPFINPLYYDYRWVSALAITLSAVLYTTFIFSTQVKIIIRIISLISATLVMYWLGLGIGRTEIFTLYFSLAMFPLLLLINIMLYYYYIMHQSRLHGSIAAMMTLMILGGAYDTIKMSQPIPDIPASTLSCMIFVLVIGYNIIQRGYLHMHGWRDYAIELEEKKKLEEMQNRQLHRINIESILMLSQTIEAKDPYTRGHCLRVRNYSRAIGVRLGFSSEQLLRLEFSAILHDIGKIGIPGKILNKPGALSEEEFDAIKKHPVIGADILSKVQFYKPIVGHVRHHHEHRDGKGYPDGLSGTDIPLESRILSVADVYDALITDRPYRKGMESSAALTILKSMVPDKLDPEIVSMFIERGIYTLTHGQVDDMNFLY